MDAWRAAAGYSIACNVHHNVTSDVEQADRHARLWHAAASKTQDDSFVHAALVAEYELAVQFADTARVDSLERIIRTHLLPQPRCERSFKFCVNFPGAAAASGRCTRRCARLPYF